MNALYRLTLPILALVALLSGCEDSRPTSGKTIEPISPIELSNSASTPSFREVLGGADMREPAGSLVFGANAWAYIGNDESVIRAMRDQARSEAKKEEDATLLTLGRLLAEGYDINAQDEHGDTALHGYLHAYSREESRERRDFGLAHDDEWQIQSGARIVEWLLANGASTDIVNKDGKTPVDYAIPEHRKVIERFGKRSNGQGTALAATP